jgi:hypothetical protein
MRDLYTASFSTKRETTALTFARDVVPIVIDLVHPHSVIDVGCARGAWLSAPLQEWGNTDPSGIDGTWVKPRDVVIDYVRFVSFNLEQPFELGTSVRSSGVIGGRRTLTASVATFVNSLVRVARVVLFVAVVPGRRGFRHVNERWPSYWLIRLEAAKR